ncbi:MAG: MarR family transcriptional regulator [Alphaproteobacteria bacterium]|nr:MarR family transcriptional regulator [Alphaproteobacteria bacterium]
MTDIKSIPAPQAASLLFLREEELREGIESFFFAYRDFVSEADALLAESGMGRAHHRALYFIGRKPGITVGELLGVLRITKQSLSRVLKELVAMGLVVQTQGPEDRRQRLLRLTQSGAALEARLFTMQRARIAKAFRDAGPDAVAGFRKVLGGLRDRGDPPKRQNAGARS